MFRIDSLVAGNTYRISNTSCPNSVTRYKCIGNKLRAENLDVVIGSDQEMNYLDTSHTVR